VVASKRGIKADVATLEALNTAFRQITSRLGITMNSRCNIGATRRGRGALASAPDLWGEDQIRGGLMGSQERAKEPPRRKPAMPFIASGH